MNFLFTAPFFRSDRPNINGKILKSSPRRGGFYFFSSSRIGGVEGFPMSLVLSGEEPSKLHAYHPQGWLYPRLALYTVWYMFSPCLNQFDVGWGIEDGGGAIWMNALWCLLVCLSLDCCCTWSGENPGFRSWGLLWVGSTKRWKIFLQLQSTDFGKGMGLWCGYNFDLASQPHWISPGSSKEKVVLEKRQKTLNQGSRESLHRWSRMYALWGETNPTWRASPACLLRGCSEVLISERMAKGEITAAFPDPRRFYCNLNCMSAEPCLLLLNLFSHGNFLLLYCIGCWNMSYLLCLIIPVTSRDLVGVALLLLSTSVAEVYIQGSNTTFFSQKCYRLYSCVVVSLRGCSDENAFSNTMAIILWNSGRFPYI